VAKTRYIIVAGVNGAGKSTLYDTDPSLFRNTKRVNADEILRQNGGDWRKQSDNFKAMRQEVKLIHRLIKQHQSFHIETTLAGRPNTQLKLIEQAHMNGFEVALLYVSLSTAELAVQRVNRRVRKGGHGIESAIVKRRYQQSLDNLPIISTVVDQMSIFDNTTELKLVYARNQKDILFDQLYDYPWLPSYL
jgi:predicted ABC-type ATPase